MHEARSAISRLIRTLVEGAGEERHRLVRFAFLRMLGFVYVAAFASAAWQIVPLVGEHGLLPAQLELVARRAEAGSAWDAFSAAPTLFALHVSDGALLGVSLLGLALAVLVLLGVENALVMLLLWALYLSIDHVGQRFWGYGWEMLLVESGLLAAFLCPLRSLRPLGTAPVPVAVIWLLRWLMFRLMLGAGLIKLRGDPCWRELTCTLVHYETQPIPNPLSWLLHQAPAWLHHGEVLFTHLAELVAPWLFFGPRRLRHAAGLVQVALQLALIASGNLSFLNYLTLALSVCLFDDQALLRLAPARLRTRLLALPREPSEAGRAGRALVLVFTALVLVESRKPLLNLVSSRQRMNESYNGLHLASSYGMFGGVGAVRPELVIEGSDAERPDDSAAWRSYELPCKPTDPRRRPCVIAPFQPRLDWQLWFAAMSRAEREPWLVHLVAKLLEGDRALLRLFAHDPFRGRPPRHVRIVRYRYRFTHVGEPGWWRREREGIWLRPVAKGDPDVARYLRAVGLK